MSGIVVSLILSFVLQKLGCAEATPTSKLQLLTVATDPTDGFLRYWKSANKHGLDVEVLGMGKKWTGGDVARFPGGGQKILLLQEALEKYKDNKDLVLMFTDSYDVILTAGPEEILRRFKKFNASVVFSAEDFCWPDSSLAKQYPEVKMTEKRFLNSGGYIGYAPQIYSIINQKKVDSQNDDQLYFTEIFLDPKLRKKLSIKLDTRGDIFQNLNGALKEVELKFKGDHSYIYNSVTGNAPIVIHGNGPIKHHLNRLGDYINDHWTPTTGCQNCHEDSISLKGVSFEDYPSVFMTIFIVKTTAFIEDFFARVGALNYPKEKINLFIYYATDYHHDDILTFMDNFGLHYQKAEIHSPSSNLSEHAARNKALDGCLSANCQYFLNIDSDAQIEDPNVLVELIERNRSVIAPFLGRYGKLWTNFWRSVSHEGFYERSEDYVAIVTGNRRGVWNVPYMTGMYLVHGYIVPRLLGGYVSKENEALDADMAFCELLRELGIFMFVDNLQYYGHIVDNSNVETSHKHNDLYQLFDNRYTWERKYLHEDYEHYTEPETVHEMPCPDVFWQPMFSPTFCKHLIEEAEANDGWSGGKHDDPRLEGGYENVPTDDIHMTQLKFEKQWSQILHLYVAPIADKVYAGYHSESRAIMNFMVRYKPAVQDRLRPHADSSTYTINVALNRPNVDYEGGGVRFLRYNCTVKDLRVGWSLMHPGRLTHHHEGLPTTGGTRYIMVSFIDP